jgi:hypothetical protein
MGDQYHLLYRSKKIGILKIHWFAKNALTNVFILSKDEAKLVFKDIYRLYNEDIIFIKKKYRRYIFVHPVP